MFTGQSNDQLSRCLEAVRTKRESAEQRDAIVALVEEVVFSLDGELKQSDIGLYQELESLAEFIRSAKTEIADLRPERISDEHVPVATDELDAIVAATEEATGTILDNVEVIEGLAGEMPEAISGKVADSITKIYEACNSQDITGRRISKAIRTLQGIEEKIEALVTALGGERERAAKPQPKRSAPAETSNTKTDADLLNGPQMPGEGISQEDIDALLAS